MNNTDIIKKIGKGLAYTVFPGYYLAKATDLQTLSITGKLFGVFWANMLVGGIVSLPLIVISGDKHEYNFNDHKIEIIEEKIFDDKAINVLAHFGYSGITPWTALRFFGEKKTSTIFDDKYKFEGKNIINYSYETGFNLNEKVINEGKFYIKDILYDEQELKENIEEHISKFKVVQEEIKQKTINGDLEEALAINSEYISGMKEKEKAYDLFLKEKENLKTILTNIVKDISEDSYETRKRIERKYNQMNLEPKKLRE